MPTSDYCPRCAARRPWGSRICQTCGLDLWKRPDDGDHRRRRTGGGDLVSSAVAGLWRWLVGVRGYQD